MSLTIIKKNLRKTCDSHREWDEKAALRSAFRVWTDTKPQEAGCRQGPRSLAQHTPCRACLLSPPRARDRATARPGDRVWRRRALVRGQRDGPHGSGQASGPSGAFTTAEWQFFPTSLGQTLSCCFSFLISSVSWSFLFFTWIACSYCVLCVLLRP